MAGQEKKVAVLDPLTLRNTVGAELAEMLEAHGVEHAEALLGVKGLRGRERLPEGGMRKASALLGIPVEEYLARSQASYLQEKPRYRAGYACAKRAYTQLKDVLPLLRGEFTRGSILPTLQLHVAQRGEDEGAVGGDEDGMLLVKSPPHPVAHLGHLLMGAPEVLRVVDHLYREAVGYPAPIHELPISPHPGLQPMAGQAVSSVISPPSSGNPSS